MMDEAMNSRVADAFMRLVPQCVADGMSLSETSEECREVMEEMDETSFYQIVGVMYRVECERAGR